MRDQISMSDFLKLAEVLPADSVRTILEIGALDGKDSVLFKSKYPNASVFSIEGLSENYLAHCDALRDQGVTSIHAIVTDYDGVIDFHKKDINGIHGIFNRGDQYGTEIVKSVPCSRIDSLCKEFGIDQPDLVKLDVEGASYEVLVGFGALLQGVKIIHLETETYPFFKGQRLHDEVAKLMTDSGFKIVDVTSVKITKDGKQMDSVWINNRLLGK
jgi:FkbM family methyltransferase